jgi:prevent-host-death family protein
MKTTIVNRSSSKALNPARTMKAPKRKTARRYSVAEANSQFAAIIRQAERNGPVEITRRGSPVAVLVSLAEFEQLQANNHHHPDLFQTMMSWREESDVAALNINPDEIWGDIRDRSLGREIDL